MNRLRVAIVTPIFPVPWDLTRGRPVYETARAMSELTDVRVYFTTATYAKARCLQPRGYFYEPLPDDYVLPGVNMEAISYPALPIVSRPFNGWVSAACITPRLRTYRPDVVLAYWIFPEGMGSLLAARRLGLPCVIGARGSDVRVRDAVSRLFTGLTLRRAGRVVTVSEELRQQAVNVYGASADRVKTIWNGCNTQRFHVRPREEARAACGLPEGRWRHILFVGRVVQAKGLMELLRAFAELTGRHADLKLIIVGDGVFMPQLRDLVASLRLRERVQFAGAVEPAQVAAWMNAADVLCLPSHSEGYPNVLVEALACGTPVVTTDVGGAREIVDDSNGIVVPVRQPEALASALEQVLQREWCRPALSARFGRSWTQVAGETLNVCQQAVSDAQRERGGVV